MYQSCVMNAAEIVHSICLVKSKRNFAEMKNKKTKTLLRFTFSTTTLSRYTFNASSLPNSACTKSPFFLDSSLSLTDNLAKGFNFKMTLILLSLSLLHNFKSTDDHNICWFQLTTQLKEVSSQLNQNNFEITSNRLATNVYKHHVINLIQFSKLHHEAEKSIIHSNTRPFDNTCQSDLFKVCS